MKTKLILAIGLFGLQIGISQEVLKDSINGQNQLKEKTLNEEQQKILKEKEKAEKEREKAIKEAEEQKKKAEKELKK